MTPRNMGQPAARPATALHRAVIRWRAVALLLALVLVCLETLQRPINAAWRAWRRWQLRTRIRWAVSEVEVIDWHAQIEPRRRAMLRSQIRGLQVELMLLH